jgi:dihydrofolate reductase
VKHLGIIVAVSENGVIGANGALPWPRIPEDMRHFRAVTETHAVVMGRKTFESIGGRPLPKRTNIVVTTADHRLFYPGPIYSKSLGAALDRAWSYDPHPWVIGGEQVYREALPHATVVHITRVHGTYEGDVFWPGLSDSMWGLAESRPMCAGASTETWRRRA